MELLISIAIIGLLSTVVIVRYDTIKINSRDARRISDITSIAKGLGIYYTINNKYPVFTEPGITITGTDALSTLLIDSQSMPTVTPDPSPSYSYVYASNTTGTTYAISFCLEGTSIKNYSQGCGNTFTP